jgi:hypothetical protein
MGLGPVLKMREARVPAGVPNREDAVGEPFRVTLLQQFLLLQNVRID